MNIITIDGPAASGKSTIARMVAEKLGYYYICSGFLYRALAYLLIHKFGYTEKTVQSVKPENIASCFDPERFVYQYDAAHKVRIFFDKEDITPYLKDSVIDKITSMTSVNEHVRHSVTLLQRVIASHYNVVVEGRDVGSAVFPHAKIKFFLTASIQVRAQRWCADQKKRGKHFTVEQGIEKIADRDKRDMERSVAPLIIPEDAQVIDNSNYDLEETFTIMMGYINS